MKKWMIAGLALISLAPDAASAKITLAKPRPAAPVYQYKPPAHLPAKSELPTPTNAVGQFFAIQSLAASQDVPTSPKPTPPNCTRVGYLNEYKYAWPTKSQSIQWWESQPGAPKKGTYAYQVGSQISHQDAEGWVQSGGCKYVKQPSCPTAAGWGGSYTWGGQWTGWQRDCSYTPQPSCPTGAGWTGAYTWNGTTKSWVDKCSYVTQPPCPTSAGWTGSYYWTGTAWASGCAYHPRPSCPTGAGWTGSYQWSGSTWANECHYQAQPACPSGDTGAYSWNGSGWVSNCKPAAPPCATTPVAFHVNSRAFNPNSGLIIGRASQWNGISYDYNAMPTIGGNVYPPYHNGQSISIVGAHGSKNKPVSPAIKTNVKINYGVNISGIHSMCPCDTRGLPTSNGGAGNGYENGIGTAGYIWFGSNPTTIYQMCYLTPPRF